MSVEQYRKFAEDFAYTAGRIMKQCFAIGMDREIKEDTSPVTLADKKINSLLIERISKLFPDHGILAEEESNLGGEEEFVWVCDPVDGTRMFAAGIPISTFSLALVRQGEVIVGVVYDPFCDRLYSAEKGRGTCLNKQRIYVSKANTLTRTMGDCELAKRAKYDTTLLLNEFIRQDVVLLKLCSFIYPSVMVATGEVGFTVFPSDTVHDAAAVKIIVEEAGGKVTDIYGNEQRYDGPINGLLVSNGILHRELVMLAKKMVVLR